MKTILLSIFIFLLIVETSALAEAKYLSPLMQFKSGIGIDEIVCKDDLVLAIKSSNGNPACVRQETLEKLTQRGWSGFLELATPPGVNNISSDKSDAINPQSLKEAANLNNIFAFDMFSNLAQGNQENAFFSPYSISGAFSILYEGARGTTQDEIQSVFHFIKDDDTRRTYANQMISDLNKPHPNYMLSTANALWVQDKFPVSNEYQDIAENYYLAKTENLDFENQPEESRKTINSWVEEKTNEKIKDLLPDGSIDNLTRAVITNAVYFLGNWTVQFDEKLTKEDDFKISEQETIKVPMMNVQQYFNYASTDDLQILQMSYKGDDLSMLVLLPKDNDLQSLEKKLSVENLNEWKMKLASKEVNVFLPKFKLEAMYPLVDNLKEMGMPSSFDPDVADFSGISEIYGKMLYVTGVFHKAFVAVDEKGTEAAAATGIVVGMESARPSPEIFRADHPFVFLIQDDRTGLILFMGKVVNPS